MRRIYPLLFYKLINNRNSIILISLFVLLLFLRFFEMETRSPFGWDQVNNAWAAQKIIDNHNFPLLGFQAKLNSGIYIGPLYYYLIAVVYFFTNLDPVASGIMAGITSIFTFFTLFYITKKFFSLEAALIAVFLNTVWFFGIEYDRIQGSINFIPSVSLVIFYSLYKIVSGDTKYLLLLGLALGLSFHIHITAIYYPIIILFTMPFFPKTKDMLMRGIMGFFITLICLIPTLIAFMQNPQHISSGLSYSHTYYHGFHLRRVLQLIQDAFIQIELLFISQVFKPLKFVVLPLFFFVYLYKSATREKLLFCYLVALWFLIPWFVLSTYSGEISDYYFVPNRFIAIILVAYLLAKLFQFKNTFVKIAIVCLLAYYAVFNINKYLSRNDVGLQGQRRVVLQSIKEGKRVEFLEGSGYSFLYYYYMRKDGRKVY